jgi:predicted  nucleic acid-binding Zn-ribbon protein
LADLRVLKLALLAETKDFIKGLDTATKEAKTFDQKLGGILASGAKALAALGVAAAGIATVIAKDLVNGAIEGQKEFNLLETAMKNYADATDISIVATNSWIDAQGRATGFGGDKLIPGFERLLRSVEDVTEAQKLLVLAQDISRATGKDLNQVTDALASAEDGRTKSLRDLGIGLDAERSVTRKVTISKKDIKKATLAQESANLRLSDSQDRANKALEKYGADSPQYLKAANSLEKAQLSAGDASDALDKKIANQGKTISTTTKEAKDFDTIVAELTEKFAGSAAKYAETYAGKVEILKESVAQLKDQLGEQLLPILERVVDFFKGPGLSAFSGFTRALTGGPRSAKGATKETNSAFAELGIVFEKNDQAGYSLGEAIRDLTKSLGDLFRTAEEGVEEESGFVRFLGLLQKLIEFLDKIVEKLDAAKTRLKEFSDAFNNSAVGQFANATGQFAPEAIAARREQSGVRVPIVNINVKGAVDPNSTARTIVKTLNTAKKTTGVFIPGR